MQILALVANTLFFLINNYKFRIIGQNNNLFFSGFYEDFDEEDFPHGDSVGRFEDDNKLKNIPDDDHKSMAYGTGW